MQIIDSLINAYSTTNTINTYTKEITLICIIFLEILAIISLILDFFEGYEKVKKNLTFLKKNARVKKVLRFLYH